MKVQKLKTTTVISSKINTHYTYKSNSQYTFLYSRPDTFEKQNAQVSFQGNFSIKKLHFPQKFEPATVITAAAKKYKLDYDPMTPPLKSVDKSGKFDFVLPEKFEPTKNRANMTEFIFPEFVQSKKVEFYMPMTPEVNVSSQPKLKFNPMSNVETNISEDYAQSVKWSNDKIARDILQNFYDGHGQTLDGVKFEIETDGKNSDCYNVKISGKSSYTQDKALLIGESTKRGNDQAAGNYGEGLKMAVLKILKDNRATDIKIASQNWEVKYNLLKSNLNEKNVLGYSLSKCNDIDGNYIEFKTNDFLLISSIKRAINYFYHSSNTDFRCPDFENTHFGFKKLQENQPGALYIAGQRFEFNNDWQGLNGFNIFFKEKPPINVFDISRDRLSLDKNDISHLIKHFAQKSSPKDLVNALHAMQEFWPIGTADYISNDRNKIAYTIIDSLLEAVQFRFKIQFPDNYMCKENGHNCSKELLKDLNEKGYIFCENNRFEYAGMQTINDFLRNARNHLALQPTEIEIQKIGIIKKALSQLKQLSKSAIFTSTELNPKIYIFDRLSNKELKINNDANAEAIIEINRSNGFWIDRGYLEASSFTKTLRTALHELTHKTGGDGTESFSYALTDVIEKLLEEMISDNANTFAELKKLKTEWDELKLKQ